LGKPITLSLLTSKNQTTKRLTIQLQGFADTSFLAQQLTQLRPALAKLHLKSYLAGTTRWQVKFDLPAKSRTDKDYTEVHFEADLVGMNINLPSPLGKIASQSRPFKVKVRIEKQGIRAKEKGVLESKTKKLGKNKSPLNPHFQKGNSPLLQREAEGDLFVVQLHYGEVLNGVFRLNPKGIERGTLSLGTTQAQLPQQPLLNIEGSLANLSITAWLKQFKTKAAQPTIIPEAQLSKNITNSITSFPGSHLKIPILLDIHFEQLEVLNQTFANLALQAKYTQPFWQAAITAPKIEGQVTFNLETLSQVLYQHQTTPPQGKKRTSRLSLKEKKREPSIKLDFKKLILTTAGQTQKSPATKMQTSTEKPPDPRLLPSLSFHCDLMKIDELKLGNVDLQTRPTYDGLKMALDIQAIGFNVKMNGQWRYVVQRHQTVLEVTLNSANTTLMLQQLGFKKPPILGGQNQLTLKSYWSDAPYRLDLAKVTGTLSLALMEGNIVEIEPGTVGRLFGLFDIYTLPRRLALDFSDIFYQGFGFNAIAGVFFLKEGIAETKHFILQGPSARVEISGQMNLVKKTFHQIITVFPQISNPLPLAGALTGGIGGGLAALVIQQLLQTELEQVLNFQYQMTGPWNKPKIKPFSK
jgi:uncharacterized protein YhdP